MSRGTKKRRYRDSTLSATLSHAGSAPLPEVSGPIESRLLFSLLIQGNTSHCKLTMACTFALRRVFYGPSVTSRIALRPLSTSPLLRKDDGKPSFPFANAPAPPRLPKEEQEIFEDLQRQSTGAFSTPQVNQSPQTAEIKVNGSGEELHPDAKQGVKPEFEGEKNPKTGEVGGPKNEPLRWGSGGDWSYGGRVTDF